MTKISAVSYLNTKPLVYGLEHGLLPEGHVLEFDIPSDCAHRLAGGEVGVGLIPVIETQRIKNLVVAPDLCIGASTDVNSVILVSESPLARIERVLLDYSSRTSAALLRVLAKRKWNISPAFVDAAPGYEAEIGGTTAALVIGDRAFHHRRRWPYVYDLAGEWIEWTRTPFVFAVWAGREEVLTPALVHTLRRSLWQGLQHLDEIALEWYRVYGGSLENYTDYLHNRIDYYLHGSKLLGLQRFLRMAEEDGLIDRYEPLRFVPGQEVRVPGGAAPHPQAD